MTDWFALAKNICLPVGGADTEEAYRAGQDCAKNGATTENCHFRFFGSKELMQAWQRGKREVEKSDDEREPNRRLNHERQLR